MTRESPPSLRRGNAPPSFAGSVEAAPDRNGSAALAGGVTPYRVPLLRASMHPQRFLYLRVNAASFLAFCFRHVATVAVEALAWLCLRAPRCLRLHLSARSTPVSTRFESRALQCFAAFPSAGFVPLASALGTTTTATRAATRSKRLTPHPLVRSPNGRSMTAFRTAHKPRRLQRARDPAAR